MGQGATCGAAGWRGLWLGCWGPRGVAKRPEARVRVKVTELKFVELWPVYQIIRAPGWGLRV